MRQMTIVAMMLLFAVSSQAAEPRIDAVPLEHFSEARTGFHLYTAAPAEIAHMKTVPGWKYHGPSGYLYPKRVPNTVALFRVGKSEYGGENNLYTTDMEEANNAITNSGWREQGIAGYVSTVPAPGTVRLYRMYHDCITPNDGKFRANCEDATSGDVHFYTTIDAERASALGSGFRDVDTPSYLWAAPVHVGGVPQIKANPAGSTTASTPMAPPTADELAIASALAKKGCKAFLGRVSGGDFLCSTQEGFDQCRRDKDRGSVQVCRPTSGVDPNKPYQLRIKPVEQKDTGVIHLNVELKDRTERIQTFRDKPHKIVDYVFRVSNASQIPADWFVPLTILPPESCWNGRASDARLVMELAFGTGDSPNQKGLCVPLLSQGSLSSISFSLPEERAIASTARITVRDRLTNLRHESNIVPVEVFGVDSVLFGAGCKRFLGRADDFICTNATGVAACENLKSQGKRIQCRIAKGSGR